jgi:outer membrane protein assembly factor BamD
MPVSRHFASTQLSRAVLLALVAALTLSGCLFRKDDNEGVSSAQAFYDKARKSLDNGDYTNSIRYYETLEARYPFSNQARQGQLDLIYAYYRNQEPESVLDASQQFERENPTHPRVDYTLYMRGMALFSGERGYFHRLFRINLSKRPPKDALDSFSAFADLLRRYPDSIYAPDTRQRMLFLRNRIAEHENHVAQFYLDRGAYAAALNRANYTLQVYDGAPTTPQALQIMVESYRKLGMVDLAKDAERVLNASYPAVEPLRPVDELDDDPWYKVWKYF